jgi:hypothetical protein
MSSIWFLSNAPVDGIFSTPSNGAYLEFNRDQFLCNQLVSNPTNLNKDIPKESSSSLCNNTSTDTICKGNTFLDIKQCEICKNLKYRDWYDSNVASTQSFSDAREEYLRAWLQSWNLGIGIIFILYGIYYQQS